MIHSFQRHEYHLDRSEVQETLNQRHIEKKILRNYHENKIKKK